MINNEDLFSKILKAGKVTESELKELVENKKKNLGYLITDDVAIRLVARDLGLMTSTDLQFNRDLKIEDLVPSMRNVSMTVIVDRVLTVKEFKRKDGRVGKIGRVIVKDDTGNSILVLWDDKTDSVHELKTGTRIMIRSGYTKMGLNGFLEIHLGEKGRIDIVEKATSSTIMYKGRIWRVFDVIEFEKKDGNKGKMVSFLLKTDTECLRVLVWNPTGALIERLIEGSYVEIHEGDLRKNSRGETELHVNDEKNIIINTEDIVETIVEKTKLSEIKPGMENLTIEGTVESELFYGETYNGKKFAKLILRDDHTALPLIFWNDKADLVKTIVRPGSKLYINGCYSKVGVNGLEIVASKWSKIRVK
ncbi:MAG: hypothetical protein H5T34_07005 [Candidatus Methanomethyliales bacterium]|nr:hypothetical protein [Candidatus Methanomethylicales archaeon]